MYRINLYSLTVSLITNTSDANEQNVAYERIKYWINEVLNDTVFINSDSDLVDAYHATGQRIMLFPDHPVDQLVGYMIYLKLNAITEERLLITNIEVASILGDDMIYVHNEDENFILESRPKWWEESQPCWSDYKSKKKSNNIISINRMPEWSELDLDWEPSDNNNEHSIVFANFPQHNEK
jgi:hypothetical protein